MSEQMTLINVVELFLSRIEASNPAKDGADYLLARIIRQLIRREQQNPTLSIQHIMKEGFATARASGFRQGEGNFGQEIALMHSELSEALEAYREGDIRDVKVVRGKPEGVVVELADALIRICEACQFRGLDLAAATRAKMKYNKTRSYRHGGKKC